MDQVGFRQIDFSLADSFRFFKSGRFLFNHGVFDTISNLIIRSQSDSANLRQLKLRLVDLNITDIHSFKFLRFTTFGCKDIEIRKSDFVRIN